MAGAGQSTTTCRRYFPFYQSTQRAVMASGPSEPPHPSLRAQAGPSAHG